MTKPDIKRIKSRVLSALIVAVPSLVLAAGPPATEVKPKATTPATAKPVASPIRVTQHPGVLLRSALDIFNDYNRNDRAASPHEPPGRPGDRPPGSPPGHDNPPNPPGRPGDRPGNNGNHNGNRRN